jgi:hypothetical protein
MNGALTELSLAEIFQVLERCQETGSLRLHVPPVLGLDPQFWICEGKIVAAVLRPGEQRLEALVQRHVSDRHTGERALEKVQQLCPCDRPLGFWLKNMGFMQPDELQRIFHHQVVTSVIACLGLGEGQYEFVAGAKAPLVELSGFSMSAMTIALLGLRDLKDWSGIVRRLPRLDSALRPSPEQPRVWLTQQEWRIWEYTNGLVSLEAIAAQMKIAPLEVQKLAFQLMVAGLVQEIPFSVLENAAEITVDWEQEGPYGFSGTDVLPLSMPLTAKPWYSVPPMTVSTTPPPMLHQLGGLLKTKGVH